LKIGDYVRPHTNNAKLGPFWTSDRAPIKITPVVTRVNCVNWRAPETADNVVLVVGLPVDLSSV